MPFLGKSPTAGFASIVKDDLTPNGSTTAFTLSKQVANANDIAVFLGNVRQEPTDAYTVSGTTLTMSEAPASGLNFYVLHIAGTVESSVVPADNTISTAKIQASAITDAKINDDAVTTAKIGASQVTDAKLASTLDLSGKSLIVQKQQVKKSDGTIINWPQFVSWGGWGTWEHTFSSTLASSATATTSRHLYMKCDNVVGNNTTGFQTSNSSSIDCYYDVQVDGVYAISFQMLINDALAAAHVDAAFQVTTAALNSTAGSPWETQYYGTDGNTNRPVGFSRIGNPNSLSSSAFGNSVVARLQEGDRIRPVIAMNGNFGPYTAFASKHNFWHLSLIHPLA